MSRESGTNICTLLSIKQLTNENLLGSTVLCGDLNGRKSKKEWINEYV